MLAATCKPLLSPSPKPLALAPMLASSQHHQLMAHPISVVCDACQLLAAWGAGKQGAPLGLVQQKQRGHRWGAGGAQAHPTNPLQSAAGVSSKHTHAEPCAHLVFMSYAHPLEDKGAGAADMQDAWLVHQVNDRHSIHI